MNSDFQLKKMILVKIIILLLSGLSAGGNMYAQTRPLQGSKVFVTSSGKGEQEKKVKAEFIGQLKSWGHWQLK